MSDEEKIKELEKLVERQGNYILDLNVRINKLEQGVFLKNIN